MYQKCDFTVWKIRKNQVFVFIPNRVPGFPLKKFEKVSGEAFFVDDNLSWYTSIHSFCCEPHPKASEQKLNQQSAAKCTAKLWCQTIALVPITHVFYAYSGEDYEKTKFTPPNTLLLAAFCKN
ncbi:hypothetical protein cypCar_00042398 [Cyprinus carpio]|nr:hypothetical protein cypCar_00042398 [Cyprinus carpio]